MTNQQALRLMRAAIPLLHTRGLCAKWVPGVPELCTRSAGHLLKCGRG